MHINRQGVQKKYRIISLMTFLGLGRVEAEEIKAGDICAIAGIPEVTIGETIADPENPEALPLINIEEPTVKMTFMVNASPLPAKKENFPQQCKLEKDYLKNWKPMFL